MASRLPTLAAWTILALCLGARPGATEQWRTIGPTNIQGQFQGGSTGRVATIAVHPGDPSHWLIGAAVGGVWRTLDAGGTWTPLTDGEASLAMGAIAFAPGNPKIVYAGTGDRIVTVGGYPGAGLLKSTDGGASWVLLAGGDFAGVSFTDIKVDPASPDVLVATTSQGGAGLDAFSAAGPVPPRGIFKSTDGGQTWTQKGPTTAVNGLGFPIGDGSDLEVHPQDFGRMYAAIGTAFGGTTNGVYRSTDAGETWALVDAPWTANPTAMGRVALALAPSDPNVLYVAAASTGPTGFLGLWRTDEAWAPAPAWTAIPTTAIDNGLGFGYCGGACWFTLEISVDPTNAGTLYASGVTFWRCTSCGASPTWTNVQDGMHHDEHAMAWAGNRLIMGNDGGVWSTTDGGQSWTNHNTTLSITQFWAGCLHPTNPDVAIGGNQDNGVALWTGPTVWQSLLSGDGGDCAFSGGNPDHWSFTFQRSLNAGGSIEDAFDGIDFSLAQAPGGYPLAKCPADDDVFITGNSRLWKSTNFFSGTPASWSANTPLIQDPISAVAFAPSDPACATYAFGTQFGTAIHLTTDGGGNWADLDPGAAIPDRYVAGLAFHPADANTLYVTLAGFDQNTPGQPGHVFKTLDALAPSPTWTDVSPPANLPHNAIAIDPSQPAVVYAGTDAGIWRSPDGGGQWAHQGPESGLPNVPVYALRINPVTHRIVVFTHGRGAFAAVRADVGVRKSDTPDPVSVGQLLTYPLLVGNAGPDRATGVVLTDVLPAGVTFDSATAGQGSCTQAAGTVTCNVGDVAPATSVAITIVVTPAVPGLVTNTAAVTSTTTDPDGTNDTATATTLVIASQCPAPFGFWKRHPELWPVGALMLGDRRYAQAELLALLNAPVGGSGGADASVALARQLIAVRLNVENGASPAPVEDAMADADRLLSGSGTPLPYAVRPVSDAGRAMIHTAGVLADYNEGSLTPACAPARDG